MLLAFFRGSVRCFFLFFLGKGLCIQPLGRCYLGSQWALQAYLFVASFGLDAPPVAPAWFPRLLAVTLQVCLLQCAARRLAGSGRAARSGAAADGPPRHRRCGRGQAGGRGAAPPAGGEVLHCVPAMYLRACVVGWQGASLHGDLLPS
jgi:hypothetical protein